jgi:hypothetical protein
MPRFMESGEGVRTLAGMRQELVVHAVAIITATTEFAEWNTATQPRRNALEGLLATLRRRLG